MSTPFYVSDSFTINTPGVQDGAWHFTGPFNMERTWGNSEPVEVEWLGGELGYVAYQDGLGGYNADVFMCLYDLGNVIGGQAQPVLVGGQPAILKFLTSTGAPMGDGILMNGVHRAGQYSRSARRLMDPVRLGGVTTPATSGPFQVGSLFRFFGASGATLAYQYFMQGRVIDAATPPPPPPPPGGDTLVMMTPDGVFSWPVTRG